MAPIDKKEKDPIVRPGSLSDHFDANYFDEQKFTVCALCRCPLADVNTVVILQNKKGDKFTYCPSCGELKAPAKFSKAINLITKTFNR